MQKDTILRIRVVGDNYTVGLAHGRAAKAQIYRLKDHYAQFILENVFKKPRESAHERRISASYHGARHARSQPTTRYSLLRSMQICMRK